MLNEVLYLQRILTSEVKRLETALDRPELNLSGWKARGPSRIMLLAGFMFARTTSVDCLIDLRDSELTPSDGEQLAKLLHECPKLTAVDVRGNESLGHRGSQALVEFMNLQKALKNATMVPRSLMGIGGGRSTLNVPKQVPPFEVRMLCAELESSVFSEGVSASMGGSKGSKATTTLNRRGGHLSDAWQPLIWAAKDGNMTIATYLIDNGHDVNKCEPMQDKGNSAWGPVHWAASKGLQDMLKMLISRGASVLIKDKHGNVPKQLAEKKGLKEIVAILDEAEQREQIDEKKSAKAGGDKGAAKGASGTSGKAAKGAKAASASSQAQPPSAAPPTQKPPK